MDFFMTALKKLAVFLGTVLSLASCTSTPPVELEQLIEQAATHWERVQGDAKQIDQPITLERALALGLERNLEFRLQMLDAALSTGNRQLATMAMLPSLTATAGYNYRDRFAGSFSQNLVTGVVELQPATSLDNKRLTTSLELGWNMLDMGLAWFAARQHADMGHVAEEHRIRLVHSVSRDIVYAWDYARAYQRIRPELARIRALVDQALERATLLEAARLRDPIEALEYRRALLLMLQQISRMETHMQQSFDELARLLDLPPGMPMILEAESDPLADIPSVAASLSQWQLIAMLNRPESRTVFYEQRMADRTALERTLRLMPTVTARYGVFQDTNSYTLNQRWQEGGTTLSWNLLQLASYPYQRRQAKLERRRAALAIELQMSAIISQVALASKQLATSRNVACLSDQLETLESRKYALLSSRQEQAALDRMTMIRAELDRILILLEAAMNQADYRRSVLMVLSSSGVGVVPDTVDTQDAEVLAGVIRSWMSVDMQRLLDEALLRVTEEFPDLEEGVEIRLEMNACDM
jgi:hypothetical protein